MFENVGIVESSSQGTLRVNPTPVSTPLEEGAVGSVVNTPFSPRITPDSRAGIMVMEYISGQGVMTMQIPSRTVVAYLRSGLNEVGLPIPDESKDYLNTEA